jgi:ligand-binding sensor domain-containing protein
VFARSLPAQEFPVRLYTPQNSNLIQTQVQRVHQAPDGKIWICTYGGLSCFDGLEFTNYTAASGLSSDVVYDVAFNKDTVFILTRDGIDMIIQNRVSSYYYNEKQKFYHGELYCSKRYLLVINLVDKANRGYIFDVRNPRKFIELPSTFDAKKISIKVNDHSAFLLQGKPEGGFHLYQQVFTDRKEKLIFQPNKEVFHTIMVEDSVIYLITRSSKTDHDLSYSLTSLKNKNGEWEQSVCKKTAFPNYNNSKTGKIGNSQTEFIIIDTASHDKLSNITNTKLFAIPNKYAMITQYEEDRDCNVWLATEIGLAKVITRGFKEIIPPDVNMFNVWGVAPVNDSMIMMATVVNGLYFYSNGNYTNKWKSPKLRTFYCGVCYGFNNDIVFAANPGVVVYNAHEKNFRIVNENMPSPSLCVYKDEKANRIYIGNGPKLISMDSVYRTKILFDIASMGINLITILSIAVENNGKILLGLATGLVEFDPATGKAGYRIKRKLRFNDLYVDSLNHIWAATNQGVGLIKGNEIVFPAIPGNKGMVRTLEAENRGRLFVAYTNYLLLVDLKKYYSGSSDCYMTYGSSNGFSGGEPKQNSFFKDLNGHLWLPTSTNILKIIPEELDPGTKPVSVKINGFAHASDDFDFVTNSATGKISLPYDRNNIRFSFSGVCLTNPESVNYQYKLEGFQDNWIDNHHVRFIAITNLPPGKYCFRVKAGIDKHFENATEATFNLIITPPFWRTWWFFSLMILLTIFIIIMGFRLGRKREQRKGRIRNELIKLKGSALSAQIDHHFLANCNAKIQILYESGRIKDANLYARLFTGFLKTNLQFMRSEEIFLNDELILVKQYMELERQHSCRFEYEIRIDPEVEINTIQVPHFLVQPVVENAIRHGVKKLEDGEGKILVNVRKHQQYIYLSVEDNGPGYYPESDINSGGNKVSMHIVRERLDLIGHGSSLTIENKNPGTVVTIKLFYALMKRGT